MIQGAVYPPVHELVYVTAVGGAVVVVPGVVVGVCR